VARAVTLLSFSDADEGEDMLPRKEDLMTPQEMVAFVRRGYDAFNAHQSDPHWLDYSTEDVAEDCEVVDMPSGMILRGPDGLKQFLLGFSTAFPDSRIEVANVFATEEHAVVEALLRGTHTGVLQSPAGDIPPSGRTFELRACDVYHLRDGKIVRHASYYDALGFMQQLGVIPAPGQAAS
jgi:steroid delta-isomerase-like uncharacterized protein